MSDEHAYSKYAPILLFGLVSLFGDIIYEGVRGSLPSYLDYLGASAFIVGLAFGLSEFLGYALRLISGILADVTKSYWYFYFIGYFLIISMPLLSFVNIWILAVILIVIERLAKAIRTPARDTLISVVSKGIGAGKAFGLHELMDQLGAVLGPLIIATILYMTNNYSITYKALFLPYAVLIIVVILTYAKLRNYTLGLINIPKSDRSKFFVRNLPVEYWLYILAVGLNTMGLIHVSLILYKANLFIAAYLVVIFYLVIQLFDAISAPISGLLYDKIGRLILLIPFILSIIPSILTITGNLNLIILAGIVFGLVYGMQESIYRAAISDLVPVSLRGTAYGIFNTVYGIGFLISGTVYGAIIERKLVYIGVVYAIVLQLIAIVLLKRSLKG